MRRLFLLFLLPLWALTQPIPAPLQFWSPVGAGALASRPSTCTANRDVYICNGTGCTGGNRIMYCTATNTWDTQGTAAGGGVTSINGLVGATQTFGNDTNVTISSAGTTHTITWAGTLAPARGGLGGAFNACTGVITFSSGTATCSTATGALGSVPYSVSPAFTGTATMVNLTVSGTLTGTLTGSISGNAATATSIAAGSSGQVPFQTGAGATGFDSGIAFNSTSKALGIFGTVITGQTGTHQGGLLINGLTSGTITLTGAAAAGTWSLILPTTGGTANYYLQTDGTGISTWAQPQFSQLGGSLALAQTPLTTAGDLFIAGAGPALARLALGANNTCLVSNGTAPLWGSCAGILTTGTAIQKADGVGGLTAAVSGTDFAPATSGSGLLSGNGAGGTTATTQAGVVAVLAPGTGCSTGTNVIQVNGNCTAATGLPAQFTALGNISTTQTFTAASNTISTWTATLTGSIGAGSTLSGAVAGQVLEFKFCQDGVGGRTFSWPTGFTLAVAISPIASACTKEQFIWDGSTAVPSAQPTVDAGTSILTEATDPGTNPGAGFEYFNASSSRNTVLARNSAGQIHIMPRTAGSDDRLDYGDLASGSTAGGDLTGTYPNPVVAKVNGVQYPVTGTLFDALPVLINTNTINYYQINGGSSCGDSSHALSYSVVTHLMGCQSITGTAAAGGSSGQIQWNNATALAGISTWTTNGTTTVTGGATSILDLSAATGTAALKVPSTTTNTATAAGVIDYDTTNSNYHGNSGADSIFGVVPTASVPVTGNVIDASVASSKFLLHDSGVATANLVTQASNAAAANQILQAGGANKASVANDFPETKTFPFCIDVNGTVAVGVTTTTAVTCTARAGTNNKTAFYGPFTTAEAIVLPVIHLPKDWNTAGNIGVSIDLASTDATSGHTVILQVASECIKLDGSTTDDVAFNAAQSMGTVTLNTTANQTWTTTLAALTTTGCAAPGELYLKITRTTDTATNVELYGAEVTIPRRPVVQAN